MQIRAKSMPMTDEIAAPSSPVPGGDEVKQYTRFKRHCSLMGQPLLCDEDIEFLTTLDLPVAADPILPHVAIMVDTSYRPHLQVGATHDRRPVAGSSSFLAGAR